jgi:hypothetical protein
LNSHQFLKFAEDSLNGGHMPKILFLQTFFTAILALADPTTVNIKVINSPEDDYQMNATFTPSKYPGIGDIEAYINGSSNSCLGYYVFDWTENTGKINFSNCPNDSFEFSNITISNWSDVLDGVTITTSFVSVAFYGALKTVQITNMSKQQVIKNQNHRRARSI